MKILIVDDEKLATTRLKRLLNELDYDDVTCLNSASDALDKIKKTKFDVVFLDIQMPEISGIELANKIMEIEPSTFVLFQTAFKEFAIDAFRVGGLDYILKPTTKENVSEALKKVDKYFLTEFDKDCQKIIGKNGDKIYLIEIDDIYYIKADLDEVIVKIHNAQCYVRRKIGDMNDLLKDKNFFRIHRSSIVNVNKIKSMESVEQSKLEISFHDIDDIITTSKEGAKDFREYLQRRTL